jgi:hypothetical protein
MRTIPQDEIGEIRLEWIGMRQRLTIDHGADRIELGQMLREPEREWLLNVLQEWISVRPVLAAT